MDGWMEGLFIGWSLYLHKVWTAIFTNKPIHITSTASFLPFEERNQGAGFLHFFVGKVLYSIQLVS